jgi:hypothetical protein
VPPTPRPGRQLPATDSEGHGSRRPAHPSREGDLIRWRQQVRVRGAPGGSPTKQAWECSRQRT